MTASELPQVVLTRQILFAWPFNLLSYHIRLEAEICSKHIKVREMMNILKNIFKETYGKSILTELLRELILVTKNVTKLKSNKLT